MDMIRVEQVRKSFGSEEILHGITRDFEEGKIHGIVGNNGSGKTVLMKCICGFLTPTEGRIFVGDQEVGRDVDFPEHMGIIIETPGFLPNLTGIKNLKILASLKGKITESDIREILQRVGLDPDLKKPVSKYSLGMRQRLGIAQAIMEDPGLLILDEPFNGLDKNGVAQMRRLIGELRDEGKTILLASHNQADIDTLCDTVCEMDAGNMEMLRTRKRGGGPQKEDWCANTGEKLSGEGEALCEELTLLENAALPLVARGISRRQRERQAAKVLREMGLGRILHAHPSMVTKMQCRLVLYAQDRLKERR